MPWRPTDIVLPSPPPAPVAAWLGSVTYAHRGLHDAAIEENSPSAFAGAIAAGLGIECDVRLTRDARAVVFHDATLDRLVGQQDSIASLTVAALTATHLAKGGEAIPTLRDLLAQVGGQVPLLLELKSDEARHVARLCAAVRRDLDGYGGPVAIMSFDPRIGGWFARYAPGIVRGLVVTDRGGRSTLGKLRRLRDLLGSRAQFLAYDIRDLPDAFAVRQRMRGLPLLTWTVNSSKMRIRAEQYADASIAEGDGLMSRGLAESPPSA